MLNHKFYFYDESFNIQTIKEDGYVRISNKLISSISPYLDEHTFTDYYSDNKILGLSKDGTILKLDDISFLKECLILHANTEKEYSKFVNFLDKSLINGHKILHVDGSPVTGGLIHNFVLTSEVPSKIFHEDFEKDDAKLQDQFINEYYNVFKDVKMYWNEVGNLEDGFNYYGITILTPEMAQQLLIRMAEYLDGNDSEAAEYFIGDDYNMLKVLLNRCIEEKKYLIHFGI
ncbi:hypothetical protein [Enterococcus termitis]|uniref:Uncharacterized protein n=1 Tax=Enterococcus termitis TaxID=332950 RepID=A0A1E5GCT1_9ENTE|nr:hypothetical protein [Enterococcus termitis]OEG10461.1 hypothetical protein BCR25_08250 [Enterococcus termitis]OJG97441.1 hypothetical protein RV18_GL000722 [Enterococcus termitis]